MDRDSKIIKVSILGIIVNIILVIFKGAIGFVAGSIAIILDAVNNLSDVLSSVITIIGTKLSGKKPDKKHPYGYGRIEYFSSMIISGIVMFAGITSFKESIDKIIHPETANYTIVSLMIIGLAVVSKFFLGKYVKKQGEVLNSGSLVASGADAISDSVLSLSTFIAAVVSMVWSISLEGYLGIVISIMILKAALEIMKETIDEMLGKRADEELTKKLHDIVLCYEGVIGVYDITLHNYGPNKNIATVHIQVDDDMKAKEIHRLTRRMTIDVYMNLGITLTVGIYASNDDEKYSDIKKFISKLVKEHDTIIQMHGFYVDEEIKFISFDVVFDFKEENVQGIVNDMQEKLKEKFPEYNYSVIVDSDFSL